MIYDSGEGGSTLSSFLLFLFDTILLVIPFTTLACFLVLAKRRYNKPVDPPRESRP